MRVTIKGLRQYVVAAAVLLVVVVAGFVLYGRYRFRHIERDLPGRLGVNIQQTANGFTYSQSSGGHTLFTLKASKEMQLKAGHVLLHNVDITMYGPPGSNRTDHIYGQDFAYDQNTGTATSQGEVHIELAGAPGSSGDNGANTIRVRTRGLTFIQKTGVAVTAEPVEFQLPRAAGSSVGANYNSKTGVLVLGSQVKLTTSSNGNSAVIGASHATLLRAQMQALLDNATVDYQTEDGSSDQATVYFRKDGTTEKIDARGHVRMKTDSGATVQSQTAIILMSPQSQPTRADLAGAVNFATQQPAESMHGDAGQGTLFFADAGSQAALRHAVFRQNVRFQEQLTGLAADRAGRSERILQAQVLNVDFARGTGNKVEARKAVAQGAPLLTLRQMPSKAPQQTTRISGDQLVAILGPGNALQHLDGIGHTRIVDESSNGARNTSQGDVLHVSFAQQKAHPKKNASAAAARLALRPAAPRSSHAGVPMQTVLETAIQDGNVVLTDLPAKKPAAATAPDTLTAWAEHAEYHAASQVLDLSGHPRIRDGATMQLSAETIQYHRDTQDAAAQGNVKATYTQPAKDSRPAAPGMGGSGPVHVIAQRASLQHGSNTAWFYGSAASPARMWQGSNSLAAPSIEVNRATSVLQAASEPSAARPQVTANFLSAMGPKRQDTLVRVHSSTLHYSDKDRRGDFHGAVTADLGNNEEIHSDDALIFLMPAAAAGQKAGTQRSQVERVVATGHVSLTQPGRRGDGAKLVYTAANGHYVLTGSPQRPPRLWDRVHGTTTGAALLFNSQNDSVEVSGGRSSAVTETRAPK